MRRRRRRNCALSPPGGRAAAAGCGACLLRCKTSRCSASHAKNVQGPAFRAWSKVCVGGRCWRGRRRRRALPCGVGRLWPTGLALPAPCSSTATHHPAPSASLASHCRVPRRRRTHSVDFVHPGGAADGAAADGDAAAEAELSTSVISAASSLIGHHLGAGTGAASTAAGSPTGTGSPTASASGAPARLHSVAKDLYLAQADAVTAHAQVRRMGGGGAPGLCGRGGRSGLKCRSESRQARVGFGRLQAHSAALHRLPLTPPPAPRPPCPCSRCKACRAR